MNSYERLFRRIEGKKVDRIPNNCIIMGFGAKYIGKSYREFATDYKVLTEAMIRCREDFNLDILSAISDPMREASGFGAEVICPENGVPYSPTPLIKELSDIKLLKNYDPEAKERTNDRLLAIRKMAEYSKKDCAVQGWVEGAFAEACDLRDLNNMMFDLIDDPDAVLEILEITTNQAIKFAEAQIDAGADIIGIGDAAASLIGPALFEEFALPYEKRIVKAIQDKDAKAKIHICGNINNILDQLTETNADIIDCDWMVDFKAANELFGDKIAACGNFDPVNITLLGKPEDVEKAVRECVEMSNRNSIIAAGCEIPTDTPIENLKAVYTALESIK